MSQGKTRKEKGGTATPDALLGLLSIRPMSGYDIRALIPQSIGHFWSESYGQIYPGLKRLAAKGLIEKKTERQKGRPDRHVYSLTPTGRAHLREWLEVPVVGEVPRSELLLKLFFGVHAPVSVSREHVSAFVARHEEAITVYAAIAKELRQKRAGDPQLPFWLMTLSFGRHRSDAFVSWGRQTLKELDAIEKAGRKRMANQREGKR
jgi:DNA-binding PadR family transcriptional regulator